MPKLPPVKKYVVGNVRIYRIPCWVFEYLSARVYLILGAGPATLVDTGSGQGESTEQILAGIETVREEFGEDVAVGDIRRILITHGHVDHVGGLWQMLEHTDAQLGIHPLDCRAITMPEERAVLGKRRMLDFLRRAGVESKRCEEIVGPDRYRRVKRPGIPVTYSLEDGLELDGIRVIHTPGHAPGHVCLAIGDVLLTGDHILAKTVSQQWPESMIPHTGLGHYLDSLDKIASTGRFALGLPAHEPVIEEIKHRVDVIRASHERRLGRIVNIVAESSSPLSIDQITDRMYSTRTGFHAVLALTDVGARVEYLHQHGRLEVVNLDEVERAAIPVCRYVAPPCAGPIE